MSSPYIFHKADDDRTYIRKMYGLECLAACFAEAECFFYHGLCSVRFPSPPPQDKLRQAARTSWTRLRHYAPCIALKTSLLSDRSWRFVYEVPKSTSSVEIWVDSTVVEHTDEKTIIDINTELTRRLWPVSTGRHVMELHYGPGSLQQGIWIFAIHGPHCGCDARIANALLDQFLRYLWDELLNAGSTSVSTLKWGQETSRLAPAAAVLTGEFDPILSTKAELQAAPAPTLTPFLPPVICAPTAQGVSITRRVLFDEVKTRAFRTLCRKHSRTVTQVIDSLYAVAHVETTLRNARARGADRFQTVWGLYETSDIWLMPWSIRDQRPYLKGYTSFASSHSTPFFACEGCTLALDMNRIRAALRYNVAEEVCARDCRKETFWDGIVQNYVDVLSTHDVTLKGFMQRARGMHQATVAFDPESLNNLSFLSSSVGDLDSLSLFAAFKGRDSGRPVVTEVHHSVSSNLAMTLAIYWQYQGKLTVSFESGVSYHSIEEMDTLGRVFEEWFNLLLAEGDLNAL